MTWSAMAALWWSIAILLHVGTAAAARVYFRRDRPVGDGQAQPPVSLLVPIKGADAELESNLRSIIDQDYPDFEVLFALDDPDDPSAPIAHRLIREGRPAVRVISGRNLVATSNPKTNNLSKAYAVARFPLVMHCDAKVALESDRFAEWVGRLKPGVGLVTAPYVGVRPRGFGGQLETAFLNAYHARFLLAGALLGIRPALGKLMLYRRADLERAGGYGRFGDNLAHDAALERVIKEQGLRIVLSPRPVDEPIGHRLLIDVCNRQVRWLVIRRLNHPLVFVGELAIGGAVALLMAALGASTFGLDPMTALVITAGVWYAVEAALVAAQGWHLSPILPLAWVVRDLVVPAMWLAAAVTRKMVWRGTVFTSRRRPPEVAQ